MVGGPITRGSKRKNDQDTGRQTLGPSPTDEALETSIQVQMSTPRVLPTPMPGEPIQRMADTQLMNASHPNSSRNKKHRDKTHGAHLDKWNAEMECRGNTRGAHLNKKNAVMGLGALVVTDAVKNDQGASRRTSDPRTTDEALELASTQVQMSAPGELPTPMQDSLRNIRRSGKTRGGCLNNQNAALGSGALMVTDPAENDQGTSRQTMSDPPVMDEALETACTPAHMSASGVLPSRMADSLRNVRRKGKTYGTRLDKQNAMTGSKALVVIDPVEGRPTDPSQAKDYTMALGVAVRMDAPLVHDWRRQTGGDIRNCLDRVVSKVDIQGFEKDSLIYKHATRHMGRKRRQYRYQLHKDWLKKGDAARPQHISEEDWQDLTTRWSSLAYQEKCRKNREIRLSYVKNLHSCGSQSFAVRRRIISEKELDGEPVGEIRLWLGTHFRPDPSGELDLDLGMRGRWSTAAAESTYREMLRLRQEAEEFGAQMTEQDICNKVLRNEKRPDYWIGRGYGFIPPSSKQPPRVSNKDLEEALHQAQEARRVYEEATQKMKEREDAMRDEIRKEVEEKMKKEMLMLIQRQLEGFVCGMVQLSNNPDFRLASYDGHDFSLDPPSKTQRPSSSRPPCHDVNFVDLDAESDKSLIQS